MNSEIKKEMPLKELLDLMPRSNYYINVFFYNDRWVLWNNKTGEEIEFKVSLDKNGEYIARMLEEEEYKE